MKRKTETGFDVNPWVEQQLKEFKSRKMKGVHFRKLYSLGFFRGHINNGLTKEEAEEGITFYIKKKEQ